MLKSLYRMDEVVSHCSSLTDSDSSKFHTAIAQEGLTACKLAAAGGHEGLVRLLLQSGAEFNAADEVMRRHVASQTQRPRLTLLPIPSPCCAGERFILVGMRGF